MLTPYIGTLELNRIHDRTLERFVADRIAKGVSATTINRSLQQDRWMIGGSACYLWCNTVEAKFAEFEFIDKDINYSDGIVLDYKIVKAFRQQRALVSSRRLR